MHPDYTKRTLTCLISTSESRVRCQEHTDLETTGRLSCPNRLVQWQMLPGRSHTSWTIDPHPSSGRGTTHNLDSGV